LDARTVRFIIAGQNGVLSDGEVLKLFVEVPGGASAGSAQIRFSNSAATDPSGNALALRSGAVNVQILGNSGPSLLPQTVLNAASLQAGALAPGEIITLFGASPANPSVLFNGTPGPVLYADSGQVNAIVPFGLDVSAPATVDLQSNGRSYLKGTITAARVAPAIFTQTGTGAGPGAILNQDYTLNSPANPAAAGSTIMVYGTGFGAVSPAAVDGQTVSNIASTVLPVTATIGGTTAKVVYAGAAPGLIAGAVQINVTIPSTLKTNPAAPLVLTISSISTPASVTVAIR
jgi:uncharacterized protein (TIGR03437 family)